MTMNINDPLWVPMFLGVNIHQGGVMPASDTSQCLICSIGGHSGPADEIIGYGCLASMQTYVYGYCGRHAWAEPGWAGGSVGLAMAGKIHCSCDGKTYHQFDEYMLKGQWGGWRPRKKRNCEHPATKPHVGTGTMPVLQRNRHTRARRPRPPLHLLAMRGRPGALGTPAGRALIPRLTPRHRKRHPEIMHRISQHRALTPAVITPDELTVTPAGEIASTPAGHALEHLGQVVPALNIERAVPPVVDRKPEQDHAN